MEPKHGVTTAIEAPPLLRTELGAHWSLAYARDFDVR